MLIFITFIAISFLFFIRRDKGVSNLYLYFKNNDLAIQNKIGTLKAIRQ